MVDMAGGDAAKIVDLQAKMKSLDDTYKENVDTVKSWGLERSQELKVLGGLRDSYDNLNSQIVSKAVPGYSMLADGAKRAGVQGSLLGKNMDEIATTVGDSLDPFTKMKGAVDNFQSTLPSAITNMQKMGISDDNLISMTNGLKDSFLSGLVPSMTRLNPAFGAYLKNVVNAGGASDFLAGNTDDLNNKLETYYRDQKQSNDETATGTERQNNMFSGLSRTGQKLAWFGFRLTMVSRIFERTLSGAISGILKEFQQWDKTIESIGTSLGFLASRGLISSDTFGTMIETMQQLPETGQMVDSIFGLLSTLFADMGNTIIPILGPAIIDLVLALIELWNANKDKIIPIIETLATETIPKLINVLKEYGGPAIDNFFQGLDTGIGIITNLIVALGPFLPQIMSFLGILIALSPIITTVGLGLYLISIPIQALSPIVGLLSGAFKFLWGIFAEGMIGGSTLAEIFGSIKIAIGLLSPYIAPLIAAFVLIWAAWDQLTYAWNNSLGPALGDLWTALFGTTGAGLDLGNIFGFIKSALYPVSVALGGVVTVLGMIIEVIAAAVNGFKALGYAMDIGMWLTDPIGNWKRVSGAIDDAKTNLGSIQDKWNTWTSSWVGKGWGANPNNPTPATPTVPTPPTGTLTPTSITSAQADLLSTNISGITTGLKDITDKLSPSLIDIRTASMNENDISRQGFLDVINALNAMNNKPEAAPITVDMAITIENVSSDVDVNKLADVVSKKITDGIQKVRTL